jgi:hypothetical protein
MLTIALSLIFSMAAHGQSQPAAVKCVEEFLTKISSIKGYSARVSKREHIEEKWLEETIGLWVEGPGLIRYTFLKDGSTGIKNNGMQLIYDGSDILKIIWGKATGFGVLANKAAKAVTGESIPLTGDTALKGELFTLNRAGYHHIAHSLRYHLPSIKLAKNGGITGEGCEIKYTPPHVSYIDVKLAKDGRIQDLEDKYGVYAFHVLQANSDKFKNLFALFNRKADFDLRVPDFLLPFEMKLNADHLPERFSIYIEGEKRGEYVFDEIKWW